MTEPAYPASRLVAGTLEAHFSSRLVEAAGRRSDNLSPLPDADAIEAIIDSAFWASLRREEGYSPKISLAFFPPDQVRNSLRFQAPLALTPVSLSRLAPAVERPGIHLGVWRFEDELAVWGSSLAIPKYCFVLEVIQPGLLVVKFRRGQSPGKFINVAVLEGDQIKILDEKGPNLPQCSTLATSLLTFGSRESAETGLTNVLVQLAASMRAHARGGSLLVVPADSEEWRKSILWPAPYSVVPPYSGLADLMKADVIDRDTRLWQEALIDEVEALAGLTAVDGATILSDRYELLAFGTKIGRLDGAARVEQVIVTEPIVDGSASIVSPLHLGGTRHLSAAQFVQDQQNAVAMVASQDGRFTIFVWSPSEAMVHAHRVEALLL